MPRTAELAFSFALTQASTWVLPSASSTLVSSVEGPETIGMPTDGSGFIRTVTIQTQVSDTVATIAFSELQSHSVAVYEGRVFKNVAAVERIDLAVSSALVLASAQASTRVLNTPKLLDTPSGCAWANPK